MAKKRDTVQWLRRITLGIMLIGMTVLTFLHQKLQGIPSIDAMDPFGGLETLMKYIAGGELIKKIEPGNIVLFAGFVILSIVLSRFFCGWFCAFGALQAVFGYLGKKIFGRRFTIPVKLDKIFRWLKYPILVVIIYLTWKTGTLIIRPYEPLAAYGHLGAGLTAVWAEFSVGLIILIAIIISSMLFDRTFCKYLCPLGAVNSILGRIPLFRIKRTEESCISCAQCDKVCPMNIDISHGKTIKSPECISCMECVSACPVKENTLVTTLGGKILKTGTIVFIGFAIFLAAALIGQVSGMLKFVAPTLDEMAQDGILNIADIKGSSTYEMVAKSFSIELDQLYREVGIDMITVPVTTMLKDTGKIAGIEGFEADTVRIAVAKIKGIPYAGETVSVPTANESVNNIKKPSETENQLVIPADFALEGTMTIRTIALELKTTPTAIIKKLELPPSIALDIPLRDMKDQYGYSMTVLKEKIKK